MIGTPPGWSFEDAIARKREALTAVFDQGAITFHPDSGPDEVIAGILHSGDEVEGTTPGAEYTLWVDLSKLGARPSKRDQINLNGIPGYVDGFYPIVDIRDDGQYGAWLDLQVRQR